MRLLLLSMRMAPPPSLAALALAVVLMVAAATLLALVRIDFLFISVEGPAATEATLAVLSLYFCPRRPSSARFIGIFIDYYPANYRTNNNFGPIGPPSQSTGALSSGFGGGHRRRTNATASIDVFSPGETYVHADQRDDAAPRGGVRISRNPFDALEDYDSASNTSSDKGKSSKKNSDCTKTQRDGGEY